LFQATHVLTQLKLAYQLVQKKLKDFQYIVIAGSGLILRSVITQVRMIVLSMAIVIR
jgi:hypothetical protein